ncbi:MAG: GspH/FimT family pseudopilin [Methylococcales bacterium]|nr:GspH/FimT family pseudopilin [Methylococcales bacterium]
MRSNAGFTLLELIIVLGIMVLGFGAVAVNMSAGNDSMALKAAARDLASGLRYVRSQAMISHAQAALNFNLSDNSYSLTGQNKIYHLAEDIDVTISTAKEDLHNGTAQLRFFPDGSSIGGRVTLEKNKLSQEININWLTGHVTIAQ